MKNSKIKLIKNIFKYIFILGIICFIIIAIPLVINSCYSIPAFCPIFKEPMKWTEFWGTYLSALASFAMVVITWDTLKQNRKQLEELKRQWNEANKPIILLKIEYINNVFFLKVENIGNRTITKAKITLGDKALATILYEGINISNIKDGNILDDNLSLGINNYQLYPLCLHKDIGKFDYIDITIEYNNHKEYHKLDMILPLLKNKKNDKQ